MSLLETEKSKETANGDITEIVKERNSRPTLLHENIMKKVIESVTNLRLGGAPVSSAVVRALERGVIIAND